MFEPLPIAVVKYRSIEMMPAEIDSQRVFLCNLSDLRDTGELGFRVNQ